MTYRTAAQDERLNELYAEHERVTRWAEQVGHDASAYLMEIEDAIWKLTDGLDAKREERAQVQAIVNRMPAATFALVGDIWQRALQRLETGPLPELPHDRAEQEQEWLSLRILAEYVPPEPEFGSKEWYDKIDPIPF